MNVKKHSKANVISFATLAVAIVALVFAKSVGTSGGEVRHTEIRNDAVSQSQSDNSKQNKEQHTD